MRGENILQLGAIMIRKRISDVFSERQEEL
ncbi:hypothetical protein ARTHRO9V_200167 [Arthrobacter sp. 9V]|nr:hypothetical protein ARTHRO9V_200167 [Arthrobacter sp. 9V]